MEQGHSPIFAVVKSWIKFAPTIVIPRSAESWDDFFFFSLN